MPFNLEKQLYYALYLIDQKKDSYKVWWVTLTSIFSAISIGGILAYFNGKIDESSIDSFMNFLLSLILVLSVLVFELFFRSIELQEKRTRIIQIYWKTEQGNASINLDSTLDLISFRKASKLFSQWRTFVTLLSIFYFVFYTIFFVPVVYDLTKIIFPRNTEPLPIPVILAIFTLSLLGMMYWTHRRVIKIINNWPEDPPWIEKKNKVENTHNDGEKN
ncbi:hypothetical protein CEE45_03475 [Candidatus Heimdallarchaeota archaeon B3_Heim]|nr:MAG: hypothetical protein CEE45_03475 [Candidatus Heimdallarchaeota archaeon B3_Heim]